MISYCTNIHPGESWDETLLNLHNYLLIVKTAVSPDKSFPIGLRLSHLATTEIDEKASAQFSEWCQKHNCYVSTVNGFPYGSFHSFPIKENVYVPDWRHRERVEYTNRLASLLDSWLPAEIRGSISTVPVGFRNHVAVEDYNLIRQNLIDVLEHIDWLRQKSGKEIILSLEPEPACVLETTEDIVRFFEEMRFPEGLRDSIGVCFDCCHQAVEFEKPRESLNILREANIKIGKVQVSAALRMKHVDKKILERFCEPSYLHQVVIRQQDGTLIRYNDLPDALLVHRADTEEEWRIHFHVPIFADNTELYGTTRYFLEEILLLLDNNILLEVETYTWHVLPPELQTKTVAESIVREIQWVKYQRDEANCCS